MKRWLGLLAIALLLSGCSNTQPLEIEDSETLPTVQSTAPSVSALYDPENPIEQQTNGAIKAYLPKDGDVISVAPMGKHLLLFAKDTVALLRGERLTEVAREKIPGLPLPGSGMLQIKEDGIAYYDQTAKRIVFLNQFFKEVGSFSLPTEIVGNVYLTPDWRFVYYCSEAGVHALDLDAGVSRLLKAQKGDWQGVVGGHLNGEYLRCAIRQGKGNESVVLISAETGTVLQEGEHVASMRGGGDCYYLKAEDDHIFGISEEQPQNFQPAGRGKLFALPDSKAAVEYTKLKSGCQLDFYDIASGKRTASIEIPGVTKLGRVFCVNSAVFFTSGDTLYRWETERSPVEDQRIYTVPRYHYEKPDESGLAAIGRQLDELETRFGVEILYWNEVEELAPWDYKFTAEFLTEPYSANLYKLERVLSQFPDGFFKEAVQWTKSGKLKVLLVRGIYAGVDTDKYASASGIQFTADGDAYIALTVGADFEQWFFHELGHLIDNRVLSITNAYSQWNKLNPWDFKYDNDYIKNQERTESKYLEGDKRHFVDLYSMSFAVEDRSRIFEYACMPGNEEVFASKYMQKKLKTVCEGIRKAFELTEESYIWEQYLQQ